MTAIAKLTAWILMAVNAWGASPIPPSQVQRVAQVREHVADSIIAVAYDVDEPPVSQGPWARARTAILFTSIFALESRFQERILTGHCIKPECDNGQAYGLGQLHVGRFGFRFVGTGFAYCLTRAADCWSNNELVDDLDLQVRAGIHIYRTQGPHAYTTYPTAVAQAKDWMAKHPPPVEDSEALAPRLVATSLRAAGP